MSTEIEKLPRLLQRAVNILEKATSAAEILEAQNTAKAAYDTIKHFSKLKHAHETIVETCHRMQADALMIETRAQCRLADEFDAAQKRGEIQKAGGRRGNQFGIITDENNASKVTEIGITSKQVFEARKIRDSEKKKPGAIRKALDEQLSEGKEPTRAAVKRAINGERAPSGKRTGGGGGGKSTRTENSKAGDAPLLKQAREIVRPLVQARQACDPNKLAEQYADTGIKHLTFEKAAAIERALRDEPAVDVTTLSMTAQEKLDIAMRAHQRKLDAAFEKRVLADIKRRMDEIILPHWKQQIDEAKTIFNNRRGVMDKATFNAVRRALHPDSRNSISDKLLAEAFNAFMKLEKRLLAEKDSPTDFDGLPSSLDEWDARRREASEERKRKRSGTANVTRV
jgi:hypothetical protein